MSGGSYDYAYARVEEMAAKLKEQKDPLRIAFGRHLEAVAKAMHDVEWVDSCDYEKGDDVEAIERVVTPALQLDAATSEAEKTQERLEAALVRAMVLRT